MKQLIRLCALTVSLLANAASAQTTPETSGQLSHSEPEGNPHSKGDYRPDTTGQPKVGATARKGAASAAFRNQVEKGSNPMANGK